MRRRGSRGAGPRVRRRRGSRGATEGDGEAATAAILARVSVGQWGSTESVRTVSSVLTEDCICEPGDEEKCVL